MVTTDDILKKYGAKIEREKRGYDREEAGRRSQVAGGKKKFSKSYEQFRSSMLPEFSRYERWCKSMGIFLRLRLERRIRCGLIGRLRLRI